MTSLAVWSKSGFLTVRLRLSPLLFAGTLFVSWPVSRADLRPGKAIPFVLRLLVRR